MTGRPFLFGKLPAHGDFVARGLTDSEQAAWDDWASAGLDQARSVMGDRFEDAHDTAPSWRFIASHATGWRLGSLAGSIDSAGRRFILVLGLADLSTAEAAALGASGAATVEAVLYDALARGTPADELVGALAGAADRLEPTDLAAVEALSPALAGRGVWWTLGGEHHPPQVIAAADPPKDLLLRVLQSSSELEMAT